LPGAGADHLIDFFEHVSENIGIGSESVPGVDDPENPDNQKGEKAIETFHAMSLQYDDLFLYIKDNVKVVFKKTA
jgi:hypothetical protein